MTSQIMAIGVRDIVVPPIPTITIPNEGRDLLERHDFLAQTTVALRQVFAQLHIGLN